LQIVLAAGAAGLRRGLLALGFDPRAEPLAEGGCIGRGGYRWSLRRGGRAVRIRIRPGGLVRRWTLRWALRGFAGGLLCARGGGRVRLCGGRGATPQNEQRADDPAQSAHGDGE